MIAEIVVHNLDWSLKLMILAWLIGKGFAWMDGYTRRQGLTPPRKGR